MGRVVGNCTIIKSYIFFWVLFLSSSSKHTSQHINRIPWQNVPTAFLNKFIWFWKTNPCLCRVHTFKWNGLLQKGAFHGPRPLPHHNRIRNELSLNQQQAGKQLDGSRATWAQRTESIWPSSEGGAIWGRSARKQQWNISPLEQDMVLNGLDTRLGMQERLWGVA